MDRRHILVGADVSSKFHAPVIRSSMRVVRMVLVDIVILSQIKD